MNNLTKIYRESDMLQAVVSTVVIYGELAEGVGGAELRDWLVSESEPVEDAKSTAEAESAASDARIAELVRQRDAVLDAYDGLERDVEERYVKLPEDADGVPIRVGDVLDPPKGSEEYGRLIVTELTHDGEDWYFKGEIPASATGRAGYFNVIGFTHVKPRTIEDVLATFRFDAKNIYDDPTLNGNERVDELETLDADVAAELRDLMEVD